MAEHEPLHQDENNSRQSGQPVEIPAKLRVHALAKLLGVTSKQVLAQLAEHGESITSAHAGVTHEQGVRVRDALAPPPDAVDGPGAADEPWPAAPPPDAAPVPPEQPRASESEAGQAQPGASEQAGTRTGGGPSDGTPRSGEGAASLQPAPVADSAGPGAAMSPLFLAATVPVEETRGGDSPAQDQRSGGGSDTARADEPASGTERAAGDAAAGDGADAGDSPDGDSSDGGSSDGGASTSGEGHKSGRSSRRRRRGRRGRGRGKGDIGGDQSGGSEKTGEHGDGGAGESAEQAGDGEPDPDEQGASGKSDQPGKPDAADKKHKPDKTGKTGRGSGGDTSDGGGEASKTASESGTEHDGGADGSSADDGGADGNDTGGNDTGGGSSRRRRRRRRRGGDGGGNGGNGGNGSGKGSSGGSSGGGDDDPPNTVVHERSPRSKRSGRDEVKGISGSTRLEAKRQRRRDGRDAGRRRPPILTESEFLARRESVDRVMVVREKNAASGGEPITQVGVLEDKVLVEHFVTSSATQSMVGNVYLGRVQNVLPSMEAAFIDIGRGRNGVLYAGEVNWSAAGLGGSSRKIEQALKPGDPIVVQVTKDPVGHKGARLTTQISLAGRFLVFVPNGSSTGISRKLPDTERKRLKSILRKIVPEGSGVIIRTASEGVSEDELQRDVDRLQELWTKVDAAADDAKASGSSKPKALYEEPDMLVKVIRDLFNEDFGTLVIEGDGPWRTVSEYVERVAPELLERIEKYDPGSGNIDVFSAYRVDEQLAKALERKVWLPSGGTLIIDRTEAMTVVDVNTGKFTGSGGNLEETVTRNNLEAAEEVVRQMRLRDIGGMIVVDFIDMVLESNRDLVLRRLTEALGRDRTRHQVSEVTSLGLVQMTRKRLGNGLIDAFSTPCEHCHGRGLILHDEPIAAPAGNAKPSKNESKRRKASKHGGPGKGSGGAKNGDAASGSGSGKDAAADAEEKAAKDKEKESQIELAHHHSEHPMIRAMAGAAETGPAAGASGNAADGASGGAEGPASGDSAAGDSAGGESAGDGKSAALAKIEAAVTKSAGRGRRRARRGQGGGAHREAPESNKAGQKDGQAVRPEGGVDAESATEPAGPAAGEKSAKRHGVADSAPSSTVSGDAGPAAGTVRAESGKAATGTAADAGGSAADAGGSAAGGAASGGGPAGSADGAARRRRGRRRASRSAAAPAGHPASSAPAIAAPADGAGGDGSGGDGASAAAPGPEAGSVASGAPAGLPADGASAGTPTAGAPAAVPVTSPPARRPRRRAAVRRSGPPAEE